MEQDNYGEEVKFRKVKTRAKKDKVFIFLVFILILLSLIGFYYLWSKNKTEHIEQTPENVTVAVDEVQGLVEKVGKLMLLPQNETPTLATVSDLSKLKGEPFFNNAEEGDKVLIYGQAKKAILYSPKKNIIIEVATVSINNVSQ